MFDPRPFPLSNGANAMTIVMIRPVCFAALPWGRLPCCSPAAPGRGWATAIRGDALAQADTMTCRTPKSIGPHTGPPRGQGTGN
jgi:hypothetical protein